MTAEEAARAARTHRSGRPDPNRRRGANGWTQDHGAAAVDVLRAGCYLLLRRRGL